MKKIILFYGSFDPIHNGHTKIASEALKLISGDKLYFGLNKSSNSKKLSSFYKRKKMIELTINNNKKFDILDIKFDYNNLDKTYSEILDFCSDNNEYYILIGQDQLNNLNEWYKFDIIKKRFKFIVANRGENKISSDDGFYYLNNKNYNISSSNIKKEGNYRNLNPKVKEFIIKNNLYLEQQLEKYLSKKRLTHVRSVKNLALKIYKNNKVNLDKNKIVSATLLHDVAREYPLVKLKRIIRKYYPEKINEKGYILHQYVGEYVAKTKFYIDDVEILEAIKYHTTANENISKLSKLVYLCDKLDPLRPYDTTSLINKCMENLDDGFIAVLKDKIEYSRKKDEMKSFTQEMKNAIKYYLKEDIDDVKADC